MKKNNRQFRKIWNIILTLVMLVSSVTLSPVNAAPRPKTILKNLIATVSQETVFPNRVIIGENGTIDSTKPIRAEISFGIPVKGDFSDPIPVGTQFIEKGDTVTFELSNAFRLLSSTPIVLNMGTTKVGTATFSTDSTTGMVTATVTFDGDDEVFDGRSNNVTARFIADFEYVRDLSLGGPSTPTVLILEKSYTLNVPALPIVYDVVKSGVVNPADKSITWTVNVSSIQGTTHLDLAGLEFLDNLGTIGTYIPGTFQIGADLVSPVVVSNTLSYVFPTGTISPKVITFKTAISNEAYFATTVQNFTNTASLRNNGTVLDNGQATVSFTPTKWIKKVGVASSLESWVANPTNRTITWTIEANPDGAALSNVIITDVLQTGLTLDNAKLQTWNGTAWVPELGSAIVPNGDSQYLIGNINSRIRLIIVSKVADQSVSTGISNYTNSASITWGNAPDTITVSGGVVGVEVGYNPISKDGVIDLARQRVRWTVNVDTKGQPISELKVYDLLVYGANNSINLNTVTGIPVGITPSQLTPRYNQKYAGLFTGNFDAEVNVIPILQDGIQVADLIEIKRLPSPANVTFSFESQVVNPNIFAGNTSSNVINTATLFSATTQLNAATRTLVYESRMLDKRMLKRSAIANPAVGVNSSTNSPAEGFDYIEKTAIFRLSVNADGIDLTNTTNINGEKLGTVTLTDILPEGWEFVDIVTGSKYLIFEGATGETNVTALDTTPDTVVDLNANISGRNATFTFPTLNKPYVILVKARVNDATAIEYFKTNQTTTTRTNGVNLSAVNWSTGVNRTQDISINSTVLSKTNSRPTAGELLWTVNYTPFGVSLDVDRIEDRLPVGIDLRIDSSGNLILAGNIAVFEMTLNTDGTYTLGSSVPLVQGTNVNYNTTTRILTFDIPDDTKAYRFTYLTDITGEPGLVSNRVSLIGSGPEIVAPLSTYSILAQDGSASFSRNGGISITKTNGSGTPLANAGFTLYALDNTTVIKTGVTGINGILTMRVIPDGTYILRETAAPAGYNLDNTSYSVVVSRNGETVTSSINGAGSSVTVKNFLVGTAGNLTLSKTVVGEGADLTKAFDFTLNLTGATGPYTYVGNGVPGGTISSGGRISLRHGQSITVLGIPLNATYSVVEDDYTSDGYTTSSLNANGAIIVDTTQSASFTNTFNVGNLVVSKTVAGVSGETNKAFDFIVTFDGAPATYNYIGSGVTDGTITSGDTIKLTHGQSIRIIGIPMGATYKVAELDYSINGYTTTRASDTGVIKAGVTQIASFINDRNIGNLRISKTVVGSTINTDKEFTFTVDLGDSEETYVYIGEGIANGSIRSGDQIKLKHNQSITIIGIPMDTNYSVEEEDYTFDGYSTNQAIFDGVIDAGSTQVADFINTFEFGNLSLRKLVNGNASSTDKQFNFTITFVGAEDTYRYLGDEVEDGLIKSGDTVSLAHNQSITIIGLPNNATYSIVEENYSSEGYSFISTNAKGTIIVGTTRSSVFTNTKTSGLPQTGVSSNYDFAKWMLILFSVMLAILLNMKYRLNKKY